MQIPMKRKALPLNHKIALILFGIVISLILAEVLLRAAEQVIFSFNRAADDYRPTFRILVIGESVTIGRNPKWPEYLEKTLNMQNLSYNFIVYNEAVQGTYSPLLLSKLDWLLYKYEPNLVIAMIGANDNFINYIFNESKKRLSYEDSILFNLISKAFHSITEVKKVRSEKYNESELYVLEGDKHLINKNFIAANLSYIKALDIYENISGSYFGIGMIYFSVDDLNNSKLYFEKSLNVEKNAESYLMLGRIYVKTGELDKAHEMFRNSLMMSQSPNTIGELWELTRNSNSYDGYIEKFKACGFQYQPSEMRTQNAKYHYTLLHSKLKKKNIVLMIVQYPTLDVNIARNLLDNSSDIIFVSNKENFEAALRKYDYFDIFVDKTGTERSLLFRGEWGHPTPYGSQLIAEQVADAIKDNFVAKSVS